MIAWSTWVIWTILSVRSEASAARVQVQAERDVDARSFLDGDTNAELATYAEQFAGLEERLDHPLLAPVRWVPVAGRQLDAARHQMGAAATGLRAAAAIGEQLRPLVRRGMSAGPERVETLRSVERTVRDGARELRGLDLGPGDHLIGALSDSRGEFAEAQSEAVATLDRTAAMSAGLARFFEGPSDYLLFAANNAQMQNGQGMFLSVGVLHVEDGRMDLGPVESINSLPEVQSPVPLEADLAARWGWLDPNTDLRHLGLSARFPVTGRTATELWAALGKPEVDGALVVDPLMMEAIMQTTGPVRVAEKTWTPDEVVRYTLHDQYQVYLGGAKDSSYTSDRRDELDGIARAVIDSFEQLTEVKPEFLDDIRRSAGGRHLLVWSADPVVQRGFEAAGVDGQISPDSLLLSLVNRSGNKLDWFMRTSTELTIEEGDGGFDAVLAVTVTNQAKPEAREPQYVIGPYPGSGLDPGEYLGLVTLNLPEGATNSRFDGVDPLAVSGADGRNRTIAAWVRLAPGTSTTLVARFRLPATATVLRIEPSARVHPTRWSVAGGPSWKDDDRRTLNL